VANDQWSVASRKNLAPVVLATDNWPLTTASGGAA